MDKPETVREAIAALAAMGLLRQTGAYRNGRPVWEIVPDTERTPEAQRYFDELGLKPLDISRFD
jgi:hypothetical protein